MRVHRSLDILAKTLFATLKLMLNLASEIGHWHGLGHASGFGNVSGLGVVQNRKMLSGFWAKSADVVLEFIRAISVGSQLHSIANGMVVSERPLL